MSDKIQVTYKVGNKMMDYLEKQIIIDYHLRGEQDVLRELYPSLDKQAKKIFGYEDYYEFSTLTGPMTENHPKFAKLMLLANDLNLKIEKELEKYYGSSELQNAAKEALVQETKEALAQEAQEAQEAAALKEVEVEAAVKTTEEDLRQKEEEAKKN